MCWKREQRLSVQKYEQETIQTQHFVRRSHKILCNGRGVNLSGTATQLIPDFVILRYNLHFVRSADWLRELGEYKISC